MKVTFQEEKQFGDAAARQYREHLKQQGIAVTDRGEDVEYLRRLVETIRPQMENARQYRRVTIYVVDSETPDARAFPGGTLFFYRGLLNFCENEAALVGVVGHELSHLASAGTMSGFTSAPLTSGAAFLAPSASSPNGRAKGASTKPNG